MRYSKLFPKTIKEAPRDEVAINAKYLLRGGFIDKLMAGSYTLLPLGKRVEQKITQIVREELNKTGAQEILMPLLHPKSIWNETGRWDKADEVMYKLKDTRDKEFALSFTHEEVLLDLVRKFVESYKDLPIYLYHFSTKFRNELRPKSGILRGREFLMKDLYSVHATKEDLDEYYFKVLEAYKAIFSRLGFSFRVSEAGGGVFTDQITHEIQVVADGGEDTIFYCDKCDFGVNKELVDDGTYKISGGATCGKCGKGKIKEALSIEVGNIFRFGTSYSEKMNADFTDEKGGKKFMYLGSYGIGTTRVMGAWVEVSHDEKGIIWNKAITPYDAHLIELRVEEQESRKAGEIY